MQHRNPRRRKRNGATAGLTTAYRAPSAAGVALNENPNRARLKVARLVQRERTS